jgi:hypothetical protein
MFEQYNILKKSFRLIIFIILVSLSLYYIPEEIMSNEDIVKSVCAIAIIFLIYDYYYPAIKIELENEKK